MKTKSITRKGSGRTKGSYSFVQIKLADLASKFADTNTQITVGRIWATSVGFSGLTTGPATSFVAPTVIQPAAQPETPTVQAQVVDLDA